MKWIVRERRSISRGLYGVDRDDPHELFRETARQDLPELVAHTHRLL